MGFHLGEQFPPDDLLLLAGRWRGSGARSRLRTGSRGAGVRNFSGFPPMDDRKNKHRHRDETCGQFPRESSRARMGHDGVRLLGVGSIGSPATSRRTPRTMAELGISGNSSFGVCGGLGRWNGIASISFVSGWMPPTLPVGSCIVGTINRTKSVSGRGTHQAGRTRCSNPSSALQRRVPGGRGPIDRRARSPIALDPRPGSSHACGVVFVPNAPRPPLPAGPPRRAPSVRPRDPHSSFKIPLPTP